MPEKPENKPSRVYTEKERMDALAVHALHPGNSAAAVAETGIPHDTLKTWAYKTRRKEYAEIRKRVQGELREAAIEKYQTRAEEAGQAADDIRAEMMLPKNLKDIPARDLPGAYRNAATAAGIYQQNALKIQEQIAGPAPAPRQLSEILKGLDSKGVKISLEITTEPVAKEDAIDGTATEIDA